MQLPPDLARDQEVVLRRIPNLLSACVDVLSSEGHLNAMSAMEISQMTIQALWDRDSPLKQIPHCDDRIVDVCKRFGIDNVIGFQNAMDPDEFPQHADLISALAFSNSQLADVANFVNDRYPDLELDFEVEDPDNIVTGSASYLNVTVTRPTDEEDEDAQPNPYVHAPFFPAEKTENWWLVIGETSTRTLLAIKKFTVARVQKVKLEFVLEKPGKHELTLFLMSDSYIGVDQAPPFEVDAAEGEDDEDEEEDDEE
jgi:pre-mRNA-splicing helicase BRR2